MSALLVAVSPPSLRFFYHNWKSSFLRANYFSA